MTSLQRERSVKSKSGPPGLGQVQSLTNVSFEAVNLTLLLIADW